MQKTVKKQNAKTMKEYKRFFLITGFVLLCVVALTYVASRPQPEIKISEFECQADNPDHTINLCLEKLKTAGPTTLTMNVSDMLVWSSMVKADDNIENKIIEILRKEGFEKVNDQEPLNVRVFVQTEKISSEYLVIVVGFSKRKP